MNTEHKLRSGLIRLAHANPELRPHLLPILASSKTATLPPTLLGKAVKHTMDKARESYLADGEVPANQSASSEVWAAQVGDCIEWLRLLARTDVNGARDPRILTLTSRLTMSLDRLLGSVGAFVDIV